MSELLVKIIKIIIFIFDNRNLFKTIHSFFNTLMIYSNKHGVIVLRIMELITISAIIYISTIQ